jgi:hypothetical protein
MRNLFAAAIVLAAGSVASADLMHYVELVDNSSGQGDTLSPITADHYTFDLKVDVTGGDDWTSSAVTGTLSTGTFYQHALGGNGDPSPALIGIYPGLAFDSFFDSPPTLLDGNGPGGFASGPTWTDSTVDATWFDVDDTGDGTYTIARFTVFAENLPGNGLVGTLVGTSTAKLTGGDLLPFDLDMIVPAPGSAMLLGLAGLAIRRRR